MADLDQAIKEKLNLIEILQQQIQELYKEKAKIVIDINKPVYEANAKAEKIIADAQVQAQAIIDTANKTKADIEEYSRKTKEEVDNLVSAVKVDIEELAAGQVALKKDKDEFEIMKQSQTAIHKKRSLDLDEMLSEVQAIKNENDNRTIVLNTKESDLNKREAENQDRLNKAIAIEQANEQKVEEINKQQEVLDKTKNDIEVAKNTNQEVLNQISAKAAEIKLNFENTNKILEEAKALHEKASKQKEEISVQLNALADAKTKGDEQQKSLDESKRYLFLLQRQVDEKIKRLEELRQASA